MSFEISPRTQLCGILLHPAGHTRSPAMHNAAFRALDIDAVYCAFDVPPASLAAAIEGARGLGIRQLAVSIPHKVNAMSHLDEVTETARKIGAINTITRKANRLVGDNTDWVGAVRALEREVSIGGKRAVVIGAGGAARGVVYGLVERGAEVVVLNRTLEKAEALVGDLGGTRAGTPDELGGIEHQILVNSTSVGLREDRSPVDIAHVRSESVVLDAVYDPDPTRLLRDAAQRGARTISGKWMLVHQAAEQLRLWTEEDAPIGVMEKAFEEAATDYPS